MLLRHWLAAAALFAASVAAHAEHFQYTVSLQGTFSGAGTDGCTPPFDQPTCPHAGSLYGTLSFDTPSASDGYYSIQGLYGDVTDFSMTVGSLPDDALYGGISLTNGIPSGSVQTLDQSEFFSFDWGARTTSYSYDFGYHSGNGDFTGSLSAVPEPDVAALLLAALVGLKGFRRKNSGSASS